MINAKFLPFLLCCLWIIFGISPASAGIFTNGGEFSKDQDNVWFLGPEPVEYCVETDKLFGLRPEQTRPIVREALSDWIEFFKKYGLDRMQFHDLTGGRSLGLSLNFTEVERCEPGKAQLRILLGKETPQTIDIQRTRTNALGFAFRGDYDHQAYRTAGGIFIRRWNFDPLTFKHLMLHELGHVFGMKHDSVAVMSEKVADRLVMGGYDRYFFGKIETPTWLYRLTGQTLDFTAGGRMSGKYEPNFVLPFLRDIFGFTRDGHHSLKLRVEALPPPMRQWKVTLEAEEFGTGMRAEMTGRFFVRESDGAGWKGVSGPNLYTPWEKGTCDELLNTRRALDGRHAEWEADGIFEFQGQTYPAILEARPGTMLRIFIPQKKIWWSTENYIGVSLWR